MVIITVIVITFNEIYNIKRTLDQLKWVSEIIVIDSGSTDGTVEIAKQYENVRIVERKFDSFANQCNFGLTLVRTPWVLSIDADYQFSDDLISEIQGLKPSDVVAGYRAAFIYRIHGRPLRATLYPPRVVLYRPERGRYQNEGHGHKLSIEGQIEPLAAKIFHDDRKPLARWFNSQMRYAAAEADYLLNTPQSRLKPIDRLRKLAWPAIPIVVFYTLFWKRCLFDGSVGWSYALQRTLFEILLALELIDRRLRSKNADHTGV